MHVCVCTYARVYMEVMHNCVKLHTVLYLNININIYIHTHTIYICMYVRHTHKYILSVYIYRCTYTLSHTHARTQIYIYIYMYTYVNAPVYIHTHIYTHTYIYIHIDVNTCLKPCMCSSSRRFIPVGAAELATPWTDPKYILRSLSSIVSMPSKCSKRSFPSGSSAAKT